MNNVKAFLAKNSFKLYKRNTYKLAMSAYYPLF